MLRGRFAKVIARNIVNSSAVPRNAASATVTAVKRATPTTSTATTSGATTSGATSANTLKAYNKTLNTTLKGKVLGSGVDVSDESIRTLNSNEVDWSNSWYGLGAKPFAPEIQKELLKELSSNDIEIKPDGLLYLPEIKYRRILNKAFGAGGWGLVPRSETIVTPSLVTREYGLICNGQLVGVARGEQDYFNENGIPTATEGCKSNALMRCCKDLGIGSELWDPVFIKKYKETSCTEKFVEHISTKRKKKIWLRKDRKVEYPYK